jgi:hypothetical protein
MKRESEGDTDGCGGVSRRKTLALREVGGDCGARLFFVGLRWEGAALRRAVFGRAVCCFGSPPQHCPLTAAKHCAAAVYSACAALMATSSSTNDH